MYSSWEIVLPSLAQQPMKGWLTSRLLASHPHMSSDTDVDDHEASINMKLAHHILSRYTWSSHSEFTTYPSFHIPHDAGLAPVPHTARNSLRKFLPQCGTRTSARSVVRSHGMILGPRNHGTRPWETNSRDICARMSSISLKICSSFLTVHTVHVEYGKHLHVEIKHYFLSDEVLSIHCELDTTESTNIPRKIWIHLP